MRLPPVLVWCLLIVISAGGAEGLTLLGAPAAWLIAPLLISIVAAVSGLVEARVPPPFFVGAQATIGCLIAETFTPPVAVQIAREWWIVLVVVVSTIIAAGIAGWIMARFGSLPAATAAWGSSPGAAAAMTSMSGDYGADPRLVAFMQYLRVTLVVLSAGAVAHFLLPHHQTAPLGGPLIVDPEGWLETLAVAVVAVLVTTRFKIPAGPLLGPMILGAALHATGSVRIVVPPFVLEAAYITIGLSIGLRYTRETVRYALRALPQLLLSTGVLIALCCLSALLLKATAHVDSLTAYLATTPGGLDSVTVIALGSGADVPLVLAIQAVRVFFVILSGPPLAKLIARIA
jgi:uncharacterized protein